MNLTTTLMDQALAWAWYVVWPIVGLVALWVLNRIAGVVRYIPNNRIAIVEKLWSFKGSIESGLIALHGEAGFQPDVLRGGFQFFLPFQYRLHEALRSCAGGDRLSRGFLVWESQRGSR